MAHNVRMPDLGQTTEELRIVEWLKAEGDSVELGESLLEVETDKATLAVEAAVAGTLLKIVHGAGETVEAGSVVAYVGKPGEALPGREADSSPDQAQKAAQPEMVAPQPAPARTERPIATPAARLLAKEHGIELHLVQGSGPGGAIEKKDVLAFIEGPTQG